MLYNRTIVAAIFRRLARAALTCWLPVALNLAASAAPAAVIGLDEIPAGPLGTHLQYLVEGDQPLSLAQAMEQYRAQRSQPGAMSVLNFGIGARPVWLRLEVDNTGLQAISKQLVGGVTWLDKLDVYVVHKGQTLSHVHSGDETLNAEGLAPAIGYAFALQFPPGASDIYLRVESIDPMVLPIELMSEAQLAQRQRLFAYAYGFVYGFLAALCIYNLLLFAGLRERSHLYYSLALLSFIACNVGYTGHGLADLWPHQVSFQAYAVLVLMVLYSVFGWLFASRFLSLAEHAPRALKAVRWLSGIGLVTMAVAVVMANQVLAAVLAFLFMGLFVVVSFLLGVHAVRQGRASGRYFLAATSTGLLGVATTDFAVWGKLPFTLLTFHAAELGFIVEATLLALALAHQMRSYQHASLHAERLARLDPLTGLFNRRAFLERAQTWAGEDRRGKRSLSLVMMDIDHFKQINDQHGHQVGDEVLLAIADLLTKQGRTSDMAARWGGEEFLLLLTETDLNQASSYAERLRQGVAAIRVPIRGGSISITASFGVAEHAADHSLVDTINAADVLLYQAKGQGRNQVCCQLTPA